jgi:hypothetical protein
MDIEYTLRCQYCQLGFDTAGDLTMHSCVEIKQESKESQDLYDKVDSIDQNATKNGNQFDGSKENSFDPASYLAKVKMEETEEVKETKPNKLKKSRKRSKISSQLDLLGFPPQLGDDYQDLELSQEFLTTIVKYVDDLCDIISNGDPNLVRTIEVNQNLNNAVNCYKNELEVKRQFLDQSNDQDYYNDEAMYYTGNDNLDKKDKVVGQSPKKKRGKYKKKKKEHNSFSKLKEEFLIDDEKLFPYLKYDIGKDMFECCLCKKTSKLRHNIFTHIKAQHMNGIKINLQDINNHCLIGKHDNSQRKIKASDLNSEPKDDCVYGTCRKIYSESYRQLWCIKCKDLPKLKRKPQTLKVVVCTVCGKSTNNISGHLKSVHEINKQKCPHCDKELQNPYRLKGHIKTVHEKLPCVHCGELIPVSVISEHIRAQHTSNDDKRHKCDICGKGFNNMGPFKDHKNIHTGEKPYKCKYCSACFASRGNHRQHEKTHLGQGRKHHKQMK